MSSKTKKIQSPVNAAKTEIVTLRLDPKTKFGLELLARKQYRTLSSVVEWAINKIIRDEEEGIPDLDKLWDVDEADRFLNIALKKTELLSYDEQLMWKIIKQNYGSFMNSSNNNINPSSIRKNFEYIIAASKGDKAALDYIESLNEIPF